MNNFLLSIKTFLNNLKCNIARLDPCSYDYSIINDIVFETDHDLMRQYRKKED